MTTWTSCPNGHRFDPSLTSECPECAILRRFTIPRKNLKTWKDENCGFNIARKNVAEQTVPMNLNDPVIIEEGDPLIPLQSLIDGSYGETMALDCDGKSVAKLEQLVTGWLVCIDGPERGKDYRLHNENNFIGSGPGMDVCISGDPTISEDRHAVVAYDSLENKFFFAISGVSSIIRLNGKPVLTTQEIKRGDRLQLGRSVFLFVPLCGERFHWEE